MKKATLQLIFFLLLFVSVAVAKEFHVSVKSIIENNHIYNIHRKNQFTGIKIHAAIYTGVEKTVSMMLALLVVGSIGWSRVHAYQKTYCIEMTGSTYFLK